jgi:hypothetical protein
MAVCACKRVSTHVCSARVRKGGGPAGRRRPLPPPRPPHSPPPNPNPTPPQAEFSAAQPASDVAALARAVAAPALAAGLYLYTAPPKAVLREKELAASLWELRLVPAAHVHVGGSGAAAAEAGTRWLRPEVEARMSDAVPDPPAGRAAARRGGGGAGGGGAEAAEAAAARERERAVAEARRQANSAGMGSAAEGGAKAVPKWLKR